MSALPNVWNTLPIPWKQDQETYELRYVFGYAMDGTDLPCYILWLIRTEDHSFWSECTILEASSVASDQDRFDSI